MVSVLGCRSSPVPHALMSVVICYVAPLALLLSVLSLILPISSHSFTTLHAANGINKLFALVRSTFLTSWVFLLGADIPNPGRKLSNTEVVLESCIQPTWTHPEFLIHWSLCIIFAFNPAVRLVIAITSGPAEMQMQTLLQWQTFPGMYYLQFQDTQTLDNSFCNHSSCGAVANSAAPSPCFFPLQRFASVFDEEYFVEAAHCEPSVLSISYFSSYRSCLLLQKLLISSTFSLVRGIIALPLWYKEHWDLICTVTQKHGGRWCCSIFDDTEPTVFHLRLHFGGTYCRSRQSVEEYDMTLRPEKMLHRHWVLQGLYDYFSNGHHFILFATGICISAF